MSCRSIVSSELLELNCTMTGGACDRDGLLQRADRDREVGGHVAALLHADVLLLGLLEAVEFGR